MTTEACGSKERPPKIVGVCLLHTAAINCTNIMILETRSVLSRSPLDTCTYGVENTKRLPNPATKSADNI